MHQLQWELNKREAERAMLRDEVAALTAKTEEQDVQLTTLSTQYDALLQMYGEKMEESQELRMDLQDIKDMYKAQVTVYFLFMDTELILLSNVSYCHFI